MADDLWPRFRRIHYGFRRIDYGKALTITAMIVFPWVIIAAGVYFVMQWLSRERRQIYQTH